MFRAYERAKHAVAFTIAAIILLLIAGKELDWATSFVETVATIARIEQTCADTRRGALRFIDCRQALPAATRRTLLVLRFVSPADGREHLAAVRCDTSADDTPLYVVGEEVTVLAHESEPGRMDRRRCTSIAMPAHAT